MLKLLLLMLALPAASILVAAVAVLVVNVVEYALVMLFRLLVTR
jgi:hypothetical protein